jgi:hypothetical protein
MHKAESEADQLLSLPKTRRGNKNGADSHHWEPFQILNFISARILSNSTLETFKHTYPQRLCKRSQRILLLHIDNFHNARFSASKSIDCANAGNHTTGS